MMTKIKFINLLTRSVVLLMLALLLGGCSNNRLFSKPANKPIEPIRGPAAHADQHSYESIGGSDSIEGDGDIYSVEEGTGEFIDQRAASRTAAPVSADGEITLNFEAQELQEVVKLVLGAIMQENYVIAPGVSGQVTFSTAKPINSDQLMPILEMLLGWNGATIVYKEGRYHVLPVNEAIQGNLTPSMGSLDLVKGYQVRAFPLQFIAPTEMEKILAPFARENAVVSADNSRGLLVLAGTRNDLKNYRKTIDTFDVDWLKGMSVGIFPVERVEADTIMQELDSIFGESATTPLAGMFRFLALERLNSILVITPQPSYLRKIESWIKRLDKGGSEAGTRLFVYAVKNVKAMDLAETLNDIFTDGGGSSSSRSNTRGQVAPGLKSIEVSSLNDKRKSAREKKVPKPASANNSNQRRSSLALVESEEIKITAVEENNALLIKASPQQYDAILAAIKRLDEVPLQVLIQAQIVEIKLEGRLQYGAQWFFGNDEGNQEFAEDARPFEQVTQSTQLSSAPPVGIGTATFGFSISGKRARALFNALQSTGKTEIISAPSLLVLNNKEANINVGDQIPVITSFNSGFGGSGTGGVVGGISNRSNSVQFRDTGVILSVTPRVNPGGLVFMEISQEVSAPLESSDTNGNVTVSRRTIETEVAVQSGETVVLGGLIASRNGTSEYGVPGLHRIPFIGKLFGGQRRSTERTELIVFITPIVIRSPEEARAVTKEYQAKFEGLTPIPIDRPEQ